MTPERTVVLLGGGFSDNRFPDLDVFLLESCRSARPRVCFIPTASGDSNDYISRFYSAFTEMECEPTHLELFRRTVDDFDQFLAEQDAVYVGGGSTANLLAIWRLHGLDEAIIRAYAKGLVLAGISAGSACWFQGCLTDSFGALSPLDDGLGLLEGSFCPHFNTEPERPSTYSKAIEAQALLPGVGLDDGAAVRYLDGRVEHVYRSDPIANLHRVEGTPLRSSIVL